MTSFDKVFLIGVGNFVEIRLATEAPKAKVSKLVRTVMKDKLMYTPEKGYYPGKAEQKVTFKQVYFVGGKIVGYISRRKCVGLFDGELPGKDRLLELNPSYITKLLNYRWRSKNL